MSKKINVAVIYGSTREGRFCDTIVAWVAAEIGRHSAFVADLVDPAVLDLPGRHGRGENAVVNELRRRLGEADAFIIVTPEYNHGYPASLKFLIDSVSREWEAKPVAFVSYGGVSGGLRAVEQLRQVFAELHATTVRDTVSFANPWGRFGAGGDLLDPEAPRQAMATLLSRLHWWASALQDARRAVPYREMAA